jgi:hypothetical protein
LAEALMSTPCKHETAPEGARFCPLCGERLTTPAAKAAAVHVQIDQKAEQVGQGGMVGMSVGEVQGNVHVVHNNVFHINNPSPEAIERLAMLGAISTEVRPANQKESALSSQKLNALEGETGEILQQVRRAEQQRGVRVEQVELGGVQVSRVELLLKRAILLKAEADQMMLDHVAAQPIQRGIGGFDGSAHERKLREALDLVREAHGLDPTNPEVLLHHAQLLGLMDEVDDKEVRRLLYQVQQLLTPPRNDADKFHLAQATFLTAVSGENTHEGQLRDARNMFAAIGRTEWVSHCDQMLEGLAWHAGFQPAGNWRVQMSDGSTSSLQLGADGSMLGARDAGPYGVGVSFSGGWAFDADNQILQVQGMTEAFVPIFLQIQMQGKQGNVFVGFGSDGYQYHFTRY